MRINKNFNNNKDKDEKRINKQIKSANVLLIGADGEKIGIMKFWDAFNKAQETGMDLVEMSSTKEHSICKVMDYGKFKYQKNKKEHKSKAKQKNIDTKEIKIHLSIGDNDFNTKIQNSIKFLSAGNKVKLLVILRGRERGRKELAAEKVEQFKNTVADYGKN